jgi:hypothetical protein
MAEAEEAEQRLHEAQAKLRGIQPEDQRLARFAKKRREERQ